MAVNSTSKWTIRRCSKLLLIALKKGLWASVEYRKEGDKLMAESMSVSMPKVMAKKEARSEVKMENPSEKTTEKK